MCAVLRKRRPQIQRRGCFNKKAQIRRGGGYIKDGGEKKEGSRRFFCALHFAAGFMLDRGELAKTPLFLLQKSR